MLSWIVPASLLSTSGLILSLASASTFFSMVPMKCLRRKSTTLVRIFPKVQPVSAMTVEPLSMVMRALVTSALIFPPVVSRCRRRSMVRSLIWTSPSQLALPRPT